MYYDGYVDSEVISCHCFFDFWFWFINDERNKYRIFNRNMISVDSKTTKEYFGKFPSSFVLKKPSDDINDNEPFYLHKPEVDE